MQLQTTPGPGDEQATSAKTELIPGLPNDLARKCLGRVNLWESGKCSAVCKRWNSFFGSELRFQIRSSEEKIEAGICYFTQDPSVLPGTFLDFKNCKTRSIPPMLTDPSTYGLTKYECAAIGRYLYVLGGVRFDSRTFPLDLPVPSSRVYRYDIVHNSWSRRADMLLPRGSFACATIGTKIIVAGGGSRHARYRSAGERFKCVEIYDSELDTWHPLPALPEVRAQCTGAYLGGKFVVFGGHSTSVLRYHMVHVDQNCTTAEVFDFETEKWTSMDMPLNLKIPTLLSVFDHIGYDSEDLCYYMHNGKLLPYRPETGLCVPPEYNEGDGRDTDSRIIELLWTYKRYCGWYQIASHAAIIKL